MVSLLTNTSAANALLNFNKIQRDMSDVQSHMTTGLKVSSARDNASTFSIAFGIKSDMSTYKTIKENLSLGSSIVNSSLTVAGQIGDQITTIKQKITQAKDQPQGRKLIDQDIQNALSQIKNFVGSATFNGVNLLDGDMKKQGKTFDVSASLDRDSSGNPTLNSLQFQGQDLSIASESSGLGALFGMSVDRADPMASDTSSKTGLDVTVTTGLAVGETMTFNYKDGQGNARTLSYTNGTAGALSAAGTMDAFYNAHKDTLKGLGLEMTHTAATATGSMTRSATSTNTFTGITMSGGSAADVSKKLDMSFNGKPMQIDDELSLSFTIGGADQTIKLKVSNSSAGANLGVDSKGNSVYALDANDVTGSGTTADGIATAVKNALINANGGSAAGKFAATAAAGVIGITSGAAGSGKITLATDAATATDNIGSAKFTSDFGAVMKQADAAEQVVKSVLGALGSASSRLDSQSKFVDEMTKTLNTNAGALVDADMAEEAAKLQALQTQSQLGVQALSIANQSPQSILSLFRG